MTNCITLGRLLNAADQIAMEYYSGSGFNPNHFVSYRCLTLGNWQPKRVLELFHREIVKLRRWAAMKGLSTERIDTLLTSVGELPANADCNTTIDIARGQALEGMDREAIQNKENKMLNSEKIRLLEELDGWAGFCDKQDASESAKSGDWLPAVRLWLDDPASSNADFEAAYDNTDKFWDCWYLRYDNQLYRQDGTRIDLQSEWQKLMYCTDAERIADTVTSDAEPDNEWANNANCVFNAIVKLFVEDIIAQNRNKENKEVEK